MAATIPITGESTRVKKNAAITMPRPQFTIRTLLWLTLVVAAFLGGMALQKQLSGRSFWDWNYDPAGYSCHGP